MREEFDNIYRMGYQETEERLEDVRRRIKDAKNNLAVLRMLRRALKNHLRKLPVQEQGFQGADMLQQCVERSIWGGAL